MTARKPELREFPGGEWWHRSETTGWAWVPIPIDALMPWWAYMALHVDEAVDAA